MPCPGGRATSSRFLCASFQSGCLSAWWSWGSSSSSCWWGSAGANAALTAAAAMSAAHAARIPAAALRPVSRDPWGRWRVIRRNVTSPSDSHVPWVPPLLLTSGFGEDHSCFPPRLHAHLHAVYPHLPCIPNAHGHCRLKEGQDRNGEVVG